MDYLNEALFRWFVDADASTGGGSGGVFAAGACEAAALDGTFLPAVFALTAFFAGAFLLAEPRDAAFFAVALCAVLDFAVDFLAVAFHLPSGGTRISLRR